jgi:hypothetical protein
MIKFEFSAKNFYPEHFVKTIKHLQARQTYVEITIPDPDDGGDYPIFGSATLSGKDYRNGKHNNVRAKYYAVRDAIQNYVHRSNITLRRAIWEAFFNYSVDTRKIADRKNIMKHLQSVKS